MLVQKSNFMPQKISSLSKTWLRQCPSYHCYGWSLHPGHITLVWTYFIQKKWIGRAKKKKIECPLTRLELDTMTMNELCYTSYNRICKSRRDRTRKSLCPIPHYVIQTQCDPRMLQQNAAPLHTKHVTPFF